MGFSRAGQAGSWAERHLGFQKREISSGMVSIMNDRQFRSLTYTELIRLQNQLQIAKDEPTVGYLMTYLFG